MRIPKPRGEINIKTRITKGGSLSDTTRGAIIALYKYNKMSFVEIGAVLNVPRETVRITYMPIPVRKTIFISKGT